MTRLTPDKFEAFKKSYDEFPSQDNEGYVPDRAGFKCGFLCAWDLRQYKIDSLISAMHNHICHAEFGHCPICIALGEK